MKIYQIVYLERKLRRDMLQKMYRARYTNCTITIFFRVPETLRSWMYSSRKRISQGHTQWLLSVSFTLSWFSWTLEVSESFYRTLQDSCIHFTAPWKLWRPALKMTIPDYWHTGSFLLSSTWLSSGPVPFFIGSQHTFCSRLFSWCTCLLQSQTVLRSSTA